MVREPGGAATQVHAACPLAALSHDGQRWTGDGVTVVRDAGRLHAFAEQCPHGSASLADAPVRRGVVTCPRHGARFRLSDGTALSGPTRAPLPCFDVEDTGEGVVLFRREARSRRSLREKLSALVHPGRDERSVAVPCLGTRADEARSTTGHLSVAPR